MLQVQLFQDKKGICTDTVRKQARPDVMYIIRPFYEKSTKQKHRISWATHTPQSTTTLQKRTEVQYL
jgi:hypothetical protein